MRIVVLGAGLAGVTTAWFLARDGHEVLVIDREPAVAAAASFANGGIIAASRPFPWPGPHMAGQFLRALWRNDQAVRLRWRWDPSFWLWGLKFLANCTARRYQAILERKARLVRYSQQVLARLVAETGIEYRRLTNGVLYVYRDAAALDRGWRRAEGARALGIAVERLTPQQAGALEPGLAADRIAGALLAPGDEAGDSALFCRELARRCESLGVRFRLETEIRAVDALDAVVKSLVSRHERFVADAFVCAAGVIEPRLAEQLGADLSVYPVKGYSVTGRIVTKERAPRRAGMDESKLIAWCPMGERIRVTGGAEFAGYARTGAPEDFARLYRAFDELFPGAADFTAAGQWACLRPMTPESTPRFGKGRFINLWFNVGGGHMGWAMAAGSGKITADLVAGREPEISLEGLRVREARLTPPAISP
ncbi:MAG: D-amino acid dehydrogenase [Pseudomonadota bacterium]